MAIGATLKAAREAKGLTAAELANELHLKTQLVEELEKDDFRNITASIYGRGFIKLCAERLGLDPAPLLAEFATVYQKPSHETAPYGTAEYRRQEEMARARAAAAARPPRRPVPIRPAEATEIAPRPISGPAPATPSVTVTPGVPVPSPAPDPAASLFERPATAVPAPVAAPEPPAPAMDTSRLFVAPSAAAAPAAASAPEPPLADVSEDTLFPIAPQRPKTVPVDPPRDGKAPRTGRFVPPKRPGLLDDGRPVEAPKPEGPGPLHRAGSAVGRVFSGAARGVGRAASATGGFFSRHARVAVFSGAALLMTLLAVWAVLGIVSTIQSHRTRRPPVAAKPAAAQPASPDVWVDQIFPPPALYAD